MQSVECLHPNATRVCLSRIYRHTWTKSSTRSPLWSIVYCYYCCYSVTVVAVAV